MLKNVLLKAGQFTDLAQKGNYISIVLAAGELKLRVKLKDGRVYSTPAVQGMALELPEFTSVAVASDDAQQTKIWMGAVPLTYSPDTARQVGSNAIVSSVQQVFSNVPTEILPAQIGRNRITLNPPADIYVGGTNLNLKNGIRLNANEPYTLATQGAVYAYEVSGGYPESYTGAATANDVKNAELYVGEHYHGGAYFFETTKKDVIYAIAHNANSAKKLDYETLEEIGTVSLPRSFDAQYYTRVGDVIYYTYTHYIGNYSQLCSFDLTTGQTTDVQSDSTGAHLTYLSFNNNALYLMGTGDNTVYKTTDFTTFNAVGVAAPAMGTITGIVVGSSGEIVVFGTTQNYRSEDDGATWQQTAATPSGASEVYGRWQIDTTTDIIYGVPDSYAVTKSMDFGRTWVSEYDPRVGQTSGKIASLCVYNGAIGICAGLGFAVRDVEGNWHYKALTENTANGENITINPSGRIHAVTLPNSNPAVRAVVEGETVKVNGLPVAVLAEIN